MGGDEILPSQIQDAIQDLMRIGKPFWKGREAELWEQGGSVHTRKMVESSVLLASFSASLPAALPDRAH